MAYATSTRTVPARMAGSTNGIFAQLGAALARRRLYSRTLAELRELSDRELSDLGISRLSIARVAHEAAYGN
ncbi:DUF1127 domain-containing protein [Neotabrizicola sp. VNH66]|uniref:DUF1127 domain-containing protein n=1 Tax=Neotabrizicola sp. VNH66 TaxID=3400918 RepID=UPI003C06F15B